MLDNFISDLYLSILQYLNVKELNIFRCLSKYLKQFCSFLLLVDWSSKINWSEIKILLSDNDYTPQKIREHNIHNWYKILKHQRQESSVYKSSIFSWRRRSPFFSKRVLQRIYYPRTKIINKIVSRSSIGWELLSYDSPVELSCCRSLNLKKWNIYDGHSNLLAKIKYSPYSLGKEQIFYILRPNNRNWFKIKYKFTYKQPRTFKIYDFESYLWENSNLLEDKLILSNNSGYDVVDTEEYGPHYCLKFKYIKPNQPSCKNCSIDKEDKCIYEFGRKDNYYLYGYQQPLHGLYAFALSCCHFLS